MWAGVLSVALGAVLLFLSFRRIDWVGFKEALVSCEWVVLFLSALTGALMPACRSLRWRHTVKPFAPAVERLDCVRANYIGYLVNMAVPFTHEATRCVIMHRNLANVTGYDTLTGVAVMERAIDGVCVLILLLVCAVLSGDRYLPFLAARFSGEDGGLSTLHSLLALVATVLVIVLAVRIIKRHNGRSRVCTGICRFFSGMGDGFRSIFRLERPSVYVLETVLLWVIYWLQLFLGTMAVPGLEEVSAADCLFLTLAVALSSVIPVPGGFGAYHFMVASALSALCDVSWTEGMAFATLVHESQTLLMIAFGVFSLGCRRHTSGFSDN